MALLRSFLLVRITSGEGFAVIRMVRIENGYWLIGFNLLKGRIDNTYN